MKVDLLIIDPQEDFCNKNGALYVKGAEKDMERLAAFINRTYSRLHDIHVTLDSHHLMDGCHPMFWKDSKGNPPDPFTSITDTDMESGKWTTREPGHFRKMLANLKTLKKSNRYTMMIWPPHCLIGRPGQAIVPSICEALDKFCAHGTGATIDYVTKGSNVFTEHYSAVQAEVPDPSDPTTQINTRFIKTLMDVDEVAIAGEAGSHCVANTVMDIANNFGDESMIKKMVLLEGCYSAVTGCEQLQTDFIDKMMKRGMRVVKVNDYLA
jgi:nicotinamidase/pyrazinamidase